MDTSSLHDLSKCQERMRQINDYIDGDIDEELCQEIERHLDNCPDCQFIVDTLSRTIKLYHSLANTDIALPEAVEKRLMQRLNLSLFETM
jgi:anti-sigma factor (TIGR02949 family)